MVAGSTTRSATRTRPRRAFTEVAGLQPLAWGRFPNVTDIPWFRALTEEARKASRCSAWAFPALPRCPPLPWRGSRRARHRPGHGLEDHRVAAPGAGGLSGGRTEP